MTKIRDIYSHIQIALHWLIVLLFVFNYIFGDGMNRIFDAHMEGKDIALWPGMTHVYVGVTMLVLVVIRLIVRRRMGVPAEAPNPREWMTVASTWTHRLLYVLMAFVPLAGMAAWFGGIDQFGEIHVLLMNALLIVSGIHAAAALYHHFIMKDGLLKRMWFKH